MTPEKCICRRKALSVAVSFPEKSFCFEKADDVENQQRTAEHDKKRDGDNGDGKGQKLEAFEKDQCLPHQDSVTCQSDKM